MNKLKITGIACGMTSGICWALDTILLGYVLSASTLSGAVILAPCLSTFFHDAFSSFWITLYLLITKQEKDVVTAMKKKSGWFIALAALCGGPLGMTGYLFAIQYIGSAYTAAISAMYPAVGAFFGYVLLKDKIKVKGIVGLLLAMIATVLLGFTSPENPENLVLGFLCALLCVFGWGLECVICAYGMKDDISSDVALQIRQGTSAIVYFIVIIPLIGGFDLLGTMVQDINILMSIAGVAFVGSASYLCYYKAISLIGPTRAMALNISYSAWAVILGAMFFGQGFSLQVFIPCIMIIVGSMMTAQDPQGETV